MPHQFSATVSSMNCFLFRLRWSRSWISWIFYGHDLIALNTIHRWSSGKFRETENRFGRWKTRWQTWKIRLSVETDFLWGRNSIPDVTAVKIFHLLSWTNKQLPEVLLHSDILSYTDVVGVHPQDQDMNRRVTARSSRQRVDAEPPWI